jgi:hypothetical protein
MFHLNIRSLRKNYSGLTQCLETFDNKFTIIALTETWMKAHNADLFNLEGDTHEHLTRESISLFIQENTNYKIRSDLNYQDKELEMLWAEIDYLPTVQNKSIVGVIYKAPGCQAIKINTKLQEIIDIANREGKTVFHTGDYNLNLINSETHTHTAEFLDINLTSSILPLITKPTRITNSSSTLIDNFFTNHNNFNININAIIPTDLSDHFPICFFFTIIKKIQTRRTNLQGEISPRKIGTNSTKPWVICHGTLYFSKRMHRELIPFSIKLL